MWVIERFLSNPALNVWLVVPFPSFLSSNNVYLNHIGSCNVIFGEHIHIRPQMGLAYRIYTRLKNCMSLLKQHLKKSMTASLMLFFSKRCINIEFSCRWMIFLWSHYSNEHYLVFNSSWAKNWIGIPISGKKPNEKTKSQSERLKSKTRVL